MKTNGKRPGWFARKLKAWRYAFADGMLRRVDRSGRKRAGAATRVRGSAIEELSREETIRYLREENARLAVEIEDCREIALGRLRAFNFDAAPAAVRAVAQLDIQCRELKRERDDCRDLALGCSELLDMEGVPASVRAVWDLVVQFRRMRWQRDEISKDCRDVQAERDELKNQVDGLWEDFKRFMQSNAELGSHVMDWIEAVQVIEDLRINGRRIVERAETVEKEFREKHGRKEAKKSQEENPTIEPGIQRGG